MLNTQSIKEGKYNSFRDYPHLESRLRQRVKPVEAALALDAILRRDEISPEARVELFAKSPPISARWSRSRRRSTT